MVAAPQHPLPTQFDTDPRVFVDQQSGNHHYEDDAGQEWEWVGQAWIPLVDEDSWKAQQSAYTVAGVDENEPANAAKARDEKLAQRKRKKAGQDKDYTSNTSAAAIATAAAASGSGSSSVAAGTVPRPGRQAPHASGPKKTAVFISNLPQSTTAPRLAEVFSKAGVLMIGDDGEPRVKLYTSASGEFKGEALVMYFKEGSVDLAVRLLDETELEMGAGEGNMRVRVAEYGDGKDEAEVKKEAPKEDGTETTASTPAAPLPGTGAAKRQYTAEEKQKMTKRIRTMQDKVTWREDDDVDDPLAPIDGAPLRGPDGNRMNRVVVLKGMFTLLDLEKDPALLLELKEDVREEAETLGRVTNVTLYDEEEDGVMTIKFKDALSADACVRRMNGRFFDKRRIYAGIFTGKERYRKSGGTRGLGDEEDDRGERERLEGFAQWLVDGSDTEE